MILLQTIVLLKVLYISLTYAQEEGELQPSTGNKANKIRRGIQEESLGQQLNAMVMYLKSGNLNSANNIIHKLPTLPKKKGFIITGTDLSIVLEYTKQLNNPDNSMYIIHALWLNMKENLHFDVYDLMSLYKMLVSEVVNKSNEDANLKTDATTIQNEIASHIVISAAEIIKQPILAGNYETNDLINNLVSSLYNDFNENMSNNAMRKVLEDVYHIADKTKLLDYMYYYRNGNQIASAMEHIFQLLKKHGNLNDTATIKLGYYLRLIRDNYNNEISVSKMNSIQAAFDGLPKIVHALLNWDEICFYSYWNAVVHSSYISSYNKNYRNVNISEPRGLVKNLRVNWRAEYLGDTTFKFVDVLNLEYLFAGEIEESRGRRQVFTYFLNTAPDDRFAWIVEWHENEFVIKNKQFNEYLCASPVLVPRGKLATQLIYTTANKVGCKWKLNTNTQCY